MALAVWGAWEIWPYSQQGLRGFQWLPPVMSLGVMLSAAALAALFLPSMVFGRPALSIQRLSKWWTGLSWICFFVLLQLLFFHRPSALVPQYGLPVLGVCLLLAMWKKMPECWLRCLGRLALVAAGLCSMVLLQRLLLPESAWMRFRELVLVAVFAAGAFLLLRGRRGRLRVMLPALAVLAVGYKLFLWWDCERRVSEYERHMSACLAQIEALGDERFIGVGRVRTLNLDRDELAEPLSRGIEITMIGKWLYLESEDDPYLVRDWEWAHKLHERALLSPKLPNRTVILLVAPDVEWESLAKFAASARSEGVERLYMVYEKTLRRAPLSVHAELEAFIRRNHRREPPRVMAIQILRLGAFCPECDCLHGNPCCFCDARERAVFFMTRLPAALSSCACAADPLSMYRLAEESFYEQHVQVVVDLCAPDEEGCSVLSLPAATPWREAGRAFLDARASGIRRMGFAVSQP